MVVMMAIYGNNSCSVLQLDIASGGGGGGRRRRRHCIRVLGLVLFCRQTAKRGSFESDHPALKAQGIEGAFVLPVTIKNGGDCDRWT